MKKFTIDPWLLENAHCSAREIFENTPWSLKLTPNQVHSLDSSLLGPTTKGLFGVVVDVNDNPIRWATSADAAAFIRAANNHSIPITVGPSTDTLYIETSDYARLAMVGKECEERHKGVDL